MSTQTVRQQTADVDADADSDALWLGVTGEGVFHTLLALSSDRMSREGIPASLGTSQATPSDHLVNTPNSPHGIYGSGIILEMRNSTGTTRNNGRGGYDDEMMHMIDAYKEHDSGRLQYKEKRMEKLR